MIIARMSRPARALPHLGMRTGDMLRMMEAVMGGSPLTGFPSEGFGRGFSRPAADLTERDDSYVVRLEVPGFAKEDLSVDVLGDTLAVTGNKRVPEEVNAHTQTFRTSFSRRVALPGELENEGHKAELKDGILAVTLKKAAPRSRGLVKVAIE